MPKPTMAVLRTLDERRFACAAKPFADPVFGQRDWALAACAEEFWCREDDVDFIEGGDGDEIVTVSGIQVGRMIIMRGD